MNGSGSYSRGGLKLAEPNLAVQELDAEIGKPALENDIFLIPRSIVTAVEAPSVDRPAGSLAGEPPMPVARVIALRLLPYDESGHNKLT